MPEMGHPLARPLRRQGLDQLLELVDLLVDVVDQVEVTLCDAVDDPVDDHAAGVGRLHRLADRIDVERVARFGCLADGEHEVVRQDDVDLLVVHRVLVVDHDGREEDAEHVVAVAAKRRARLVLVLRRCEQPFERGVLELARRV